uniref:B3 domain-containing transcription factor FUS3 n=1 Tax=Anthurium amnicola TaxID=1678845 RepID=A0A1D1ZBI5_9ARAE
MEGPWDGEDAFLACFLGSPLCPAAEAGRGKGEEPSRNPGDGARKALVDAGFLRVVQGFGPRRKKRSARQRRLVVERLSPSAPATLPSSKRGSPPSRSIAGSQSKGILRFLLQKELRKSDVGSLGRMVLPKKEAEAHLPVLIAREGIHISMEDMETSHMWTFKYRYWPNNKSRMYILENIGEFVKGHGLKLGDFVLLYRDDYRQRYVLLHHLSQ